MVLRIANAAGFWGDDPDAPRRLLARAEVDFLTLEYLAELTMSILAEQRQRDPRRGYATDLLDVLESVIAYLKRDRAPRIVTNAGGVNPLGCVKAVCERLVQHALADMRVGCVCGDDLTPRLQEIQSHGWPFAHLDSGQPLAELNRPVVAAHAYLGAEPICQALDGQAQIVITGRVADASLTVGPCMHQYGWSWDDWNRLAGATVAGHLIECGAQVTGGYSVRWPQIDLHDIGYPIAEIDPQADCVITKPVPSGGCVDRWSVIEQLVYEIDDPQRYMTPDVVADFTSVQIEEIGPHRVAVRGARGAPRPEFLKVSLAYYDGYTSAIQLAVAGRQAQKKARLCADLILDRLSSQGCQPESVHVEYWGAGASGAGWGAEEPYEIVLRVAIHDARREVVEYFTRLAAPLITSGPAGLAGYATGRSPVRPVLAYWPTLVPRDLVQSVVEVKSARQWLQSGT